MAELLEKNRAVTGLLNATGLTGKKYPLTKDGNGNLYTSVPWESGGGTTTNNDTKNTVGNELMATASSYAIIGTSSGASTTSGSYAKSNATTMSVQANTLTLPHDPNGGKNISIIQSPNYNKPPYILSITNGHSCFEMGYDAYDYVAFGNNAAPGLGLTFDVVYDGNLKVKNNIQVTGEYGFNETNSLLNTVVQKHLIRVGDTPSSKTADVVEIQPDRIYAAQRTTGNTGTDTNHFTLSKNGLSFNGDEDTSGGFGYDGIQYLSGSTVLFQVDDTGSVTGSAFYQSSDETLKDNISNITDVDKVANVSFKEFTFKNDENHTTKYGVIAQDVEKAGLKNLVSTKDDGYKTVDYISLLCLKMEAMQKRIDELEKKLESK